MLHFLNFRLTPYGLEGEPPEGLPENAEDGSLHEAENGNKYQWIGKQGDQKGFWLETGDDTQILDEVAIVADAKNVNGTAKSDETSFHLSYNLDGQQYNFYDLTYDEKNTLVADYWQRKWQQQRQSRQKSFWDVHMPTYDIDYPSVLPQAVSLSVELEAAAGAGAAGEFEFTWITQGEDAAFMPYITYNQKFGGGGVNVGASAMLSISYKTNGSITKENLITSMDANGIRQMLYYGREVSMDITALNVGSERTRLKSGEYIDTYTIGISGDIGNETIYGGSIMSTISIPINFK